MELIRKISLFTFILLIINITLTFWRKIYKRILSLYLMLLMLFVAACGRYEAPASETSPVYEADAQVWEPETSGEDVTAAPWEDESESSEADVTANLPTYGSYYYDLANVVLYLEVYEELPPNYITKSEARALGWEGGSVEAYREGAAIGGDSFGNREGLLPEADGRSYTECDIDTDGYGSRGSRRLVFSNDGLYFYTSDHYETFSEVTVTEDYEVIW